MSRTLRILVVEDNRADADLIRELLPQQGPVSFQIESAARLAEAITRLDGKAFDLILLDLGLPDSQGLDTFRKLRQAVAEVPVIVLSGANDEELAVTAVQEGAQDYLVKGMVGGSLLIRAILHALGRHKTEAQIRWSETQLQVTLEATADGILAVDNQGKIIKFNRRFAEIWKIPQSILERRDDKSLLAFVLEQVTEPEAFLKKVEALYASDAIDMDTILFKDSRILERYSAPMLMAGKIMGRVWSFRDVTERQQAQERLRDSEAKFRHLFDGAVDAVCVHDAQGWIKDVNQKVCDQLGYTREELLRMSVADIETGVKLVNLGQVWEQAGLGQSITVEGKHRRRDGSTFPVEVRVLCFTDLTQGCRLFYAASRDITERKQAEQALGASEEKFRGLFNNAEVGMFRSRLDGAELLDINDKYLSILGQTREDVIGKPSVLLWVDPKERDEMVKLLKVQGRVDSFECQLRKKTGEVIYCLTSLKLDSGTGILDGSIRDITERKRAEVEVQRQAAFACFNPNPVLELSAAGEILYCNAATLQMANALGQECPSRILPPNTADIVRDCLATNQSRLRLETNEKGCVISWSFFPVVQNNVVHCYAGDITERKRAEAALRESQERYQSLFNRSLDCVFLHDFSGNILDANQAMLDLLGFQREDIPTLNFDSLLSEEQRRLAFRTIEEIKAIGHQKLPTEFWVRGKDGRQVDVETRSSLIYQDGKPYAIQGIARDLTERKRAELALQESEALLKESQRIAKLGSYVTDFSTGRWSSSEVLDQVFGIGPTYDRSVAGWTALIHPADRAMMVDYLEQEVIGRRQPFNKEYRIVRQNDQAERWVNGLGKLEFDAQGRPLNMVGTIQDITERKRAEQAQKETEELFTATFHASPIPISITDPATEKWLAVNQAFLDVTGYTRAEIIGHTFREINLWKHPGDRTRMNEIFAAQGRVVNMEVEINTKGGATGTMLASVEKISLSGKPHLLIMGVDITERKRAEALVRGSEEQFRTMFELASIGMAQADPRTGRWVRVNQKMLAITGYSEAELLEMRIPDLTHSEDRQKDADAFQQVIRGEAPDYRMEKRYLRKDGSVIWVNVNMTVIRDAASQPVRTMAAVEDITERKRVQESHDRLAMAVEQAAETIVINDTQGTIRYANPAFEKTTGYTCAEALGQNPRVLKSGKQDPAYYRQLWETLQSGQVWNGHFINKRKDGKLYEEEATISPIRDGAGKIINFVAVKRDVTHEVELEGQLRQSQKMEAIGTLAGGIAHDFNNILNVIFGYCNLLQLDLAGKPDELDKVGEILKAGERAKDLVQQILTFSRQREQERRVIHLNTVLKETVKLLRASLPVNIQIETKLAADAPMVLADATQIYQVIMNLSTNAMHAMEGVTSGRLAITLEAFQPDEAFIQMHPELRAIKYARLSISDTGSGMDARTLARIFEPFFTTKSIGKGTGLGLAVVHGIVEAHDGVIMVESQPGQGTVFRLYFPEQIQDMFLAGIPEDLIPCGQGQRILMVDDEAALMGMYQLLLKALKYEGTVIAIPEEAVTLVRKNPAQYDLVITDLTMPGMNGLELARQIHDLRADLPIILATGFQGTVTQQQLEGAGICELVDKPISMAALAKVLRGILGSK